ncbi:MAG TPA: Holliday junction ATP-dependent DNA helicase RuvA [Candidatus Paceibacterota bacterium]|nr:Holliday junction ATP-dependent DNA helicase RuvA [Candidatus Paceibacterota bacterium]HMO82591.1 Holliday junction ATP-dependent DNA helicase RuvA [Candidatus Paceibacterota bacterium]
MIRSLEGTIASLEDNGVVLSVNQIGYLIHTSTTRTAFVPGDTVFFHTHLVVRENALDLYGFTEKLELYFFELLLSVPKIGPKSALQILNQADTSLLSSTILTNDPDQLHKLSGISKKMAANITTHLAGKLDHLDLGEVTQATPNSLLSPNQIDAIDALITLGYSQTDARNYVQKQEQGGDTKSIIQAVLKEIPIR